MQLDYTPTEWENKVWSFMREAVATYGNAPAPRGREKQKPAPDAGFWRDIDKSNARENQKRMAGKLDFEYWRRYYSFANFPAQLLEIIPAWKREVLSCCFDRPT